MPVSPGKGSLNLFAVKIAEEEIVYLHVDADLLAIFHHNRF